MKTLDSHKNLMLGSVVAVLFVIIAKPYVFQSSPQSQVIKGLIPKALNVVNIPPPTHNEAFIEWTDSGKAKDYTSTCKNPGLPSNDSMVVFLISRDRRYALKEAVDTIRGLRTRVSLVVIDQFTTEPSALQYLKQLESEGVLIHNMTEWNFFAARDHVWPDLISNYMNNKFPTAQFWILSDSDIALRETEKLDDILQFHSAILNACPDIHVVGPHLRIDDLPDHYPRKADVVKCEGKYWQTDGVVRWGERRVNISLSAIDTTFSMRRRTRRYKNLDGPAVRTGYPYWAAHVDWYLPATGHAEHEFYMASILKHQVGGVNHWGITNVSNTKQVYNC